MAKKKENTEELIDQTVLAESIAEKIPYSFREDFLIKPLDPIKVQKEFTTPVPKTGKTKKDKNGIAAVDYDEVKTETKEVDADYRLGVVIKTPYNYTTNVDEKYIPFPVKAGDVIVFRNGSSRPFDLLKDSALVRIYDILGTMETKKNESK